MAPWSRTHRNALTTALVLAVLVGCGGETPDALLASARDYLAKDDPKAAAIQIKAAIQKDPGLVEARFLLGKALLQGGDPVGAEVELRKAIDGKYPADEAVPLLAQALLASGQAKKVLAEFEKTQLVSADAKADLQTSIAVAHAGVGNLDKARTIIDSALAVKPDLGRAQLMKARFLMAAGDVDGGLAVLDAIQARDPKAHDAAKLRGDALNGQKKTDEALAAYRKALDIAPNHAATHAAIVGILLGQDKLDDAGRQLEAMKKAVPKHSLTFLTEAEYRYQKREFKPALEAVQNVLKVAPEHPKALLIAGAVQSQLKMFGQAEESLGRALKLAPNSTLARRLLATVHLRTGQPAKALTLIQPLLDDGDNDPVLMSLAGDVYMQTGDVQKAGEYFTKAVALDPKNAAKQTKVALTHLLEGKTESAFGELERIAAGDSGTTADMALIATAIRNKDYAKATKAIDALEKKQPDNPMVPTLRGGVLMVKGDIPGARKEFEKALAAKPGYYPAAASLAGLDIKEGKPDDAKKRFETMFAADPKNFQAGMALADMAARTGAKPDELAALLSKVIQASPNEPAPRLALIRLHLQNKDPKKAVAAAQDAVSVLPDRPEVLAALSTAQQAAGDHNQALATAGKLVAVMPGSGQPYIRMAEVNVAAKNKDEAIRNLRKALDMKPDLLPAQIGLVNLYLDAKNFREAQSVATEVKRQRPKESIGYLLDGDVAVGRKAWPEAVSAYRAGLKEAPATDLAIKLYAAHRAAGNSSEAEKLAANWLADHSNDAGFRLAMAESEMAQKDYPAAVRHYQVLLQGQPNNPIVLNNLAWVLGQLKDPRSLDYAEKANRIAPDQPVIMETLGSLLAEKGELDRAQEILLKAVGLAPESGAVKLSLAKVQIKAGKTGDARRNLQEASKLGDKFSGQAEVAKLLKEIGS